MLIDISQLKFTKIVHGIIHVGAHNCEERINYLLNFHNVTDDCELTPYSNLNTSSTMRSVSNRNYDEEVILDADENV